MAEHTVFLCINLRTVNALALAALSVSHLVISCRIVLTYLCTAMMVTGVATDDNSVTISAVVWSSLRLGSANMSIVGLRP